MSDKPWHMGMSRWHVHNWAAEGLRICAGPGDVCRFEHVVAEMPTCRMCKGENPDDNYDNPHPRNCRRCGGPTSRGEQKERALARFARIINSVNGCAGIPEPRGVSAMLDFVWGIAHDEDHEDQEAAMQLLVDMGFFRDEEEVAEELMT